MSGKINVWSVFCGHMATMRHHGEDRVSVLDVTVFFICPGIVAAVVYLSDIPLTDSLIGALINASAILLGLLLNLLVLMFDQKSKAAELLDRLSRPDCSSGGGASVPVAQDKIRHIRLRGVVITESVSNISFAVLLCIASLVSLLGFSMRGEAGGGDSLESFVCSLNTFLWLNVSLTILMIIKRVFVLFSTSP
ncbi:hypothetical protein ABE522_03270 [Stenotrophomonas pennii]|uniref:hypothetical protein n=1 Tax=Stenotrophomonas lacuserhaii TaxID=2760084 RepID=UPI0032080516